MNDAERARIEREVREATHSFESAERALDAERLLDHFARDSAFHLHSDGERLDFEAVAAGVRGAFPALRALEGGFRDMHVFVLAPDSALVSARFEETVTPREGPSLQRRGAASWLWRRGEGGWRIAYGHVDHQPAQG